MARLFWLFKVHFYISAFTFGGGYVVIPMIRRFFVKETHLFGEEELMDMAAIAQTSPGAIAVNLAVLSGYKTAGKTGAAVSLLASVLPPFIILSLVSTCYLAFKENQVVSWVLKGMEAGVAAVIVDLVAGMARAVWGGNQAFFSIIMILVFAASFFLQVSVALLIPASCIACFLLSWLPAQVSRVRGRKTTKEEGSHVS